MRHFPDSKPNLSEEGLAQFTSHNKKALLGAAEPPEDSFSNEHLDHNAALIRLKKEAPKAYWLMRLKYITSVTGGVKNIVIIVDDIEALSASLQWLVIFSTAHSYNCLIRDDEVWKRDYKVHVVIALRPDTIDLLRSTVAEFRDDAYALEEIVVHSAPPLDEIFKADFLRIMRNPEERGNEEVWRNSCGILGNVCSRLNTYAANALAGLTNHNVRQAFIEFTGILTNRPYFQGGKPLTSFFHLSSPNQFNVSDQGVHLSLAKPHHPVYLGQEDCVTPNILHNGLNPWSDMLILYVLKRFLLAAKTDPVMRPRARKQFLSEIVQALALPVPDGTLLLDEAIEYMLSRALVYASRDANQAYLSITHRASVLWQIVGNNSILLDCYREDTFREFADQRLACLSKDMKVESLNIDVAQLLIGLAEREAEHIRISVLNEAFGYYLQLFGQTTIISHLVRGYMESLKVYFREGRIPQDLKNTQGELADASARTQALLDKSAVTPSE
jgi:hypothetical protein